MSNNTPITASPDFPWTEGLTYNQAVKTGDLVFTAWL